MSASPFAQLNAQQRKAVQHGGAAVAQSSPPLLIIAGAGSGKTNTLAHRVAHIVLCGVDPRQILLLTFSRRAAVEMTRRVERVVARAGEAQPGALVGCLTWSGTFHAIGSRLLRMHALALGLDPAYTVLDRGDAADLMDLIRVDRGLAKGDRRFPKKDTCLAIY